MKYLMAAIMIMAMLLLAGCQPGDKKRGIFGGKGEEGIKTFIGGTQGLLMEFTEQRPPQDVFAGGDDPFDVEVQVVNDGEFDITKDDIIIVLTGVDPHEFSKTQQEFIKKPDTDLEAKYVDPEGNVIESLPQYVVYENLNHADPVIGTLEFPLRAEACYSYGTNAISQLCYKKDLRRTGGVCEVTGEKEVRVSGSPIQIEGFKQSAASANSFAFTFTIVHKANGQIYQQGECTGRPNENKVYVKVDTGSTGLSCSGLRDSKAEGEGVVDLRAGSALIRCRQDVREDIQGSFVKPVNIEVLFNYKEAISTSINVKQSEI